MSFQQTLLLIAAALVIFSSCDNEDEFGSNNPQEFLLSISLTGEMQGDTAISLSWTDLKMEDYENYHIYYAYGSDSIDSPNSYLTTTVKGVTNYIFNHLPLGNYISYQVRAQNMLGDEIKSNVVVISREGIKLLGFNYERVFLNESNTQVIFCNDGDLRAFNYETFEQEGYIGNMYLSYNYPITDHPTNPDYIIVPDEYVGGSYGCKFIDANTLEYLHFLSVGSSDYIAADNELLYINDYQLMVYNITTGELLSEDTYTIIPYDEVFAAPWEDNWVFITGYNEIAGYKFNDQGQLLNTIVNESVPYLNASEVIFSPNEDYLVAGTVLFTNELEEVIDLGYVDNVVFSADGEKLYYETGSQILEYDISTETSNMIYSASNIDFKDLIYTNHKLIAIFSNYYNNYIVEIEL